MTHISDESIAIQEKIIMKQEYGNTVGSLYVILGGYWP